MPSGTGLRLSLASTFVRRNIAAQGKRSLRKSIAKRREEVEVFGPNTAVDLADVVTGIGTTFRDCSPRICVSSSADPMWLSGLPTLIDGSTGFYIFSFFLGPLASLRNSCSIALN